MKHQWYNISICGVMIIKRKNNQKRSSIERLTWMASFAIIPFIILFCNIEVHVYTHQNMQRESKEPVHEAILFSFSQMGMQLWEVKCTPSFSQATEVGTRKWIFSLEVVFFHQRINILFLLVCHCKGLLSYSF